MVHVLSLWDFRLRRVGNLKKYPLIAEALKCGTITHDDYSFDEFDSDSWYSFNDKTIESGELLDELYRAGDANALNWDERKGYMKSHATLIGFREN